MFVDLKQVHYIVFEPTKTSTENEKKVQSSAASFSMCTIKLQSTQREDIYV